MTLLKHLKLKSVPSSSKNLLDKNGSLCEEVSASAI